MTVGDRETAAELASRAEILMRQGGVEKARQLYGRAARAELTALKKVPRSRPRTHGIMSVSAASLFYKAKEYDRAEEIIHKSMVFSAVPPAYRAQLQELLEVIWDEKTLPASFEYSGEELTVSLRGHTVGTGTAPLDTALRAAVDVRSLCYRSIELEAGLELRKTSLPSAVVSEQVQARATQPGSGSYRLGIRFIRRIQGDLLSPPDAAPSRIAARVICIARAIQRGDSAGLIEAVPKIEYRQTLQRIVRNLIKVDDLNEVLFSRASAEGKPGEVESVSLLKNSASWLSENIRHEDRSRRDGDSTVSEEKELRGILRAVDLDSGALKIVTDSDVHNLDASDHPVDDVIGPMVNRRVVARGRWKNVRGRGQVLFIRDIEPDAQEKN